MSNEAEFWTELDTRILRYDGVSIASTDELVNLLLAGAHPSKLRTSEESVEVQKFNATSNPEEMISSDIFDFKQIKTDILISEEFKNANLIDLVIDSFSNITKGYTSEQVAIAEQRLSLEIFEFERRGISDYIRAIAYMVDTFKKTDTLWGVGRGSSCASYYLYLLGLHLVDPVKYDIPLSEFLK